MTGTVEETSSRLNLDDSTENLEAQLRARAEQAMEKEAEPTVTEVNGDGEAVDETIEEAESDMLYEALASQGFTRNDANLVRERFGNVYVYIWDAEHMYIYRALNRKEWNLIRDLAQDEEEGNFLLIQRGCIFPSFTSNAQLEEEAAGLKDVLSTLIQRQSGFIGLQEAINMVREL